MKIIIPQPSITLLVMLASSIFRERHSLLNSGILYCLLHSQRSRDFGMPNCHFRKRRRRGIRSLEPNRLHKNFQFRVAFSAPSLQRGTIWQTLYKKAILKTSERQKISCLRPWSRWYPDCTITETRFLVQRNCVYENPITEMLCACYVRPWMQSKNVH